MSKKMVTLAVTGASGSPYFVALLKNLLLADVTVSLVLSEAAKLVIKTELAVKLPDSEKHIKDFFLTYFAEQVSTVNTKPQLYVYRQDDWMSAVASGSNCADAMVICPCSMGTLSAISHGASNNLIERAADVMLKEQRQLILLTREMPYSTIHLENMLTLSRMGVTIMPASPGFYHKPLEINDLVDFVVARILDHLHVDHSLSRRWGIDDKI